MGPGVLYVGQLGWNDFQNAYAILFLFFFFLSSNSCFYGCCSRMDNEISHTHVLGTLLHYVHTCSLHNSQSHKSCQLNCYLQAACSEIISEYWYLTIYVLEKCPLVTQVTTIETLCWRSFLISWSPVCGGPAPGVQSSGSASGNCRYYTLHSFEQMVKR